MSRGDLRRDVKSRRLRPRSGRLQGSSRDRDPRERIPVLRNYHWRRCENATVPVITIPLPIPFSTRAMNCYLLEGDPLTLVDPGADWAETALELGAAMAARGRRVEEVEQVILTHQHYDHVGLAHVVKSLSGCTVVGHELLGPFLADLGASMEAEDTYQADVMRLHGVPEAAIHVLYETSKQHRRYGGSVVVDRVVRDGDVIDAGTRSLTVHYRPGHSPTDTIFVDEEARLAIVGDHLIGHISSNPVTHRPLSRPADPRNRFLALPAYLDSLRRTAELDLDVLLPGHGNPVEHHRDLVEERLEFHERRKQRIFDGLGDEPRTAHELALGLWGSVAEREAFLTLSEALGHLDLLEQDDAVRAVEGSDGMLRYERTE
jgi:glyoxylase-like metal-dependent hydrolase (beta-lactamase superfamily II)